VKRWGRVATTLRWHLAYAVLRAGLKMIESEVDALVALAHLGEPGDQVLGAYVRKLGPVAAVAAITARKSGLRDGAGLHARIGRPNLMI